MTEARNVAAAFLMALEQHDVAALERLLADDVVEVLPLAAAGGVEPAATFEQKADVLRVQQVIVNSFDTVVFHAPVFTVGEDGTTVFVETIGERRHRETGRTYRNVYLYKFDVRNGVIRRISEYSNPVTFAKFFDQPIG